MIVLGEGVELTKRTSKQHFNVAMIRSSDTSGNEGNVNFVLFFEKAEHPSSVVNKFMAWT